MTSGDQAKFPRTEHLPTQSPLFWVEQKDRYLRQLLIRDIEAVSARRLVAIFGNRFAHGSDIQGRDVAYVYEVTRDCAGQPLDILLETNGGNTDVAEAIVSLLQELKCQYRIVIANAAKSNGTLISLSATSIVMGPTSELGPIEPHFAGAPVSTWLRDEIKEKQLGMWVNAGHFLRQSTLLATRYLQSGMMKGKQSEIEATVNALATRVSYPTHGTVIDRTEASKLGLVVEMSNIGDPFWDRIWLLYCMYDYDTRLSNVAKIFEGRQNSLSIGALPPPVAGP